MILVFIMHAMLATIFPIGRAIEGHAQPIFFTAIRMLMSGLILLIYQYFNTTSTVTLKKTWHPILYLSIYAIFGLYLTNVAEFWALQFVPAAKASFIYSLCPFFAAIMAYFFFTEKLTIKKLIGMTLGFTGVLAMILLDSPGEELIGPFRFVSLGELALVFAALTTTFGWVYLRKLVRIIGIGSIQANAIGMIAAGVLALITSLFTETWNPIPVSNYTIFMQSILLAVLFSNIIGYTLYGVLLKRYTTTLLSFAGFIEPLCAAIYAWILLAEHVNWVFYVAGSLVFGGLYIFYNEDLKQGYILRK